MPHKRVVLLPTVSKQRFIQENCMKGHDFEMGFSNTLGKVQYINAGSAKIPNFFCGSLHEENKKKHSTLRGT